MYQISELAQHVGLSRSTLLYYEKLGLITGRRQNNGYRIYSEHDRQRIKLLQQLQAGGLSLKECQACLEGNIDKPTLEARLAILDAAITEKQSARELLAALLGKSSMRPWHQSVEQSAPAAHLEWLMKQGFSEKNALRLKWLSKDMNEHEQYMIDFESIFQGLDRLGPGDDADSLRALQALPRHDGNLLEIGCGKGPTTRLLAQHTAFDITALDNDEYSLSCLKETVAGHPWGHRIETCCASMTDMPFASAQFDVLWAEGSAYIMGVPHALKAWKRFLKPEGYLVLSDLVWLTHTPDAQAEQFWQVNYPGMVTVDQRLKEAKAAGYEVVESFPQSAQAWRNYLEPLNAKLAQLSEATLTSQALNDLRRELHIHQHYLGQYGYHIWVLKNKG